MMPDALFRVIGNGDVDTRVGVFHEGTRAMLYFSRVVKVRAPFVVQNRCGWRVASWDAHCKPRVARAYKRTMQ